MPNPSCLRVSYSLKKTVRCHCSSYKYPHNWGTGDCQVSIIDNPPVYSPPRRGLSAKLARLLEVYSSSEDEFIQEFLQELTGL